MTTEQKVSPEEMIAVIDALHANDALHGMSRDEVADAMGVRTVSQDVQVHMFGLGYRPTYRNILQYNDGNIPVMVDKKVRVKQPDGSTKSAVATDENGNTVQEQWTRSICFFVDPDREFFPDNAQAGTRAKGSRASSVSALTPEIKEQLAGMSLVNRTANDVEDELGVTLSGPDLREIAEAAGLKVGFTTIRHGHYKTFKPAN